jgi:hypothetical protein
MKTTTTILIALTSSLTVNELVHAALPAFQDARAFAMGGTGVAGGRPASASFYNPALLSIWHKASQDDFNLTLPSLHARIAHEEELVEQMDDIQESIDDFNAAVSGYDPNTGSGKEAVRDSARQLQEQLRAVDGDTTRGELGLALAIQKPDKELGMGLFSGVALRANVRGQFSKDDDVVLNRAIESAEANREIKPIGEGEEAGEPLSSTGAAVVVVIAEAGITLSREIELGGNALALGVSPKYMQIRTYDYRRSVSSFDEEDFDTADYETRKSGFNMNLGAAYTFGESSQWVAGASVRNLIPMDVDTVNDHKVEVDPRITVGLAHRSRFSTLAVDLDLTENRNFSFEGGTQWLGLGGEVDAFDLIQLRAGVRHNLAYESGTRNGGGEETQFTAGVALSPFGARLEVSGMLGDGEIGAAAELGMAY